MNRAEPCVSADAPSRYQALAAMTLVVAAALPAIAQAQAGPCADPWINQAFQQMYRRAPIGSGKNIGECDLTRYGNGHWSSYQDLTTKIAQHGPGSHVNPTVTSGSDSSAARAIHRA